MPKRSTVMAATTHMATEADLQRTPDDGWKYELVDGEIRRVSPAGSRHGRVCVELAARLNTHVKQAKLGYVFDSSTGFRLPGGNVRSPDVSFVGRGRFEGEKIPAGFSPVAPDLAVEVLSPDDRPRALLDKIGEYLQAGVRLVWVIDPERGAAAAYRSLIDVKELGIEGTLDGEDVVQGFKCPLQDILA
jgi:Uma2 family endonuclease